MQHTLTVGVVIGLAAGMGAGTVGCYDSFATCVPAAACPSQPAGGGAEDPACEGDPTTTPALVTARCGVFVRASAAPRGDGSKEKPLQTLGAAAEKGARRVYACAEEYAEAASVRFGKAVEIYAGFAECDGGWRWSAEAKGKLVGPADAIALALEGGEHRIENLNVVAADATVPGGSSIGVLVNGGALAMKNGSVTAGAGADGENGESPEADPALDGTPGNPGSNACTGDIIVGNVGGAAVTKECGDATSVGAKGGDGGRVQASPLMVLAGGDGEAGQPAGESGHGGVGEPVSGEWYCSFGPGLGAADVGAWGANGTAGAGAGDTALGKLNAAGFVGAAGAAGTAGKMGQGGGGGGGAKGGRICTGSTYGFGASGGGGGSGGCGGKAGGGGNAGGSSIAIASLSARLVIDSVALKAGLGGKGGQGGAGQPGGTGGSRGSGGQPSGGSNSGCFGGIGGEGGNGGPGGGGRGGHSIGIAYTGDLSVEAPIETATAGEGGDGGLDNEAAGKGAPGVSVKVQRFSDAAP